MKATGMLLLIVGVSLLTSCDFFLPSEEKPESVEKGANYEIMLIDRTGSMQQIYSKDGVANAQVIIKSNTIGTEFNLISDAEGIIRIEDAISDLYTVSAVRRMTAGFSLSSSPSSRTSLLSASSTSSRLKTE